MNTYMRNLTIALLTVSFLLMTNTAAAQDEPSVKAPPVPATGQPASPPAVGEAATPVPEAPVVHQGPATEVPTVPSEPVTAAPVEESLPAPPVEESAAQPLSQPAALSTVDPTEPTPSVPEDPPAPPEFKFPKFTFSPQVGYAYFADSEYKYDAFTLRVDNRNSFLAKAQFDLGGDGMVFQIAPLFAMEQIGGDLTSIGQDLSAGVGGKFFAVGGQIGMLYRGSIGKFFPHIGIGFHGTYLMGDDIQYGAELYGRIPAGFTVYFTKGFGMMLEAAFMYGATGIRGPDPDPADLATLAAEMQADYGIDIAAIDWSTADLEQIQADYGLTAEDMETIVSEQVAEAIKFGKGFVFEIMLGFRFP